MGAESSTSNKHQTSMQAETYYNNSIKEDILTQDYQKYQQIQLYISIKNALINTDYNVQIYISDESNQISSIGSTSTHQIDQQGDINFKMSYIMNYYFEKQQKLIFKINKKNHAMEISTTLGNVMGSRGQTLLKDITETEKLLISAKALENNDMNINLTIHAYLEEDWGLFFTLKKKINSTINKISSLSVYKSEVKFPNKNNFKFNKIKIPSGILCDGNYDNTIIIEFYNYTNQHLLETHLTSINKLLSDDRSFTLSIMQNVSEPMKKLKVNCDCTFTKEYTFIDYLRGGLQLALSIGIDFTGSNGHPAEYASLHHLSTKSIPNSYERAIRSCGDILAYYDYDNSFPVYGYGAILPRTKHVSPCFPLNLTDNPDIISIDNVLQVYKNVVNQLTFSGPTLFSPLLSKIIYNLKNSTGNVYHVLLILTDGMINDMDDTIDRLVEASFLPLSVIIVGIGNNDFGNMNILDADDEPLIDRFGRKSGRDLVQFVPFNKFQNDGRKLAEQVLEEIPQQVTQYFSQIAKSPPGDPVINL